MKKIILILVMCLFLTACNNGTDSQETTTATVAQNNPEEVQTEEPAPDALVFPDLPDADFEGYNFNIINTTEQDHLLWLLIVEEETGVRLEDDILRRNRRMEEKFGFNLVQIPVQNSDAARDRARLLAAAGSDDFDLAMMEPAHAIALAQSGLLARIDDIPHIDLSQPWWDQEMNKEFSIGGRLLFTVGDFSFNQYSVTMGVLFNKPMLADLALENPYQLVRDGKWTMDKFAEMARGGQVDLNGDGAYDQRDQWGFVAPYHVYTPAFIIGMGEKHVTKDSNDLPVLNMSSEGFIERFLKLFDTLEEGWHWDHWATQIGDPETMFLNNQTLFWSDLLHQAVKLRSMDNDFGILPIPKLDEQQADYISEGAYPHVMTIPVTSSNLERTGIILEALNAESRITTLSSYLDTMLVTQMTRDEESGEMLDIIFSNRVYDMGKLFWRDQTTGPIADLMKNNSRNIVSALDRILPSAEKAIQRTVDVFLDEKD